MKKYSVDVENTVDALAYCFEKLNSDVDMWDWNVTVNTGGVNYGMYLNFDFNNRELEISNEPCVEDTCCLDDIIEVMNGEEEE